MTDPYRGFNFRVEIDGITEAGFQECSGLDVTTDPVEYRVGTDPNHVRKLTGLNKFSPVMLKRGITDSQELWQWQQSTAAGRTQRRNVSIVLVDESGTEKMRWNLLRAWASKWTGPTFNATSNEVAVEQLEICHEELVRA
ncbi:phage tail protein [Scytonema hofmannii PCC 7110]|uniref:Phage tail protein n=1 Tax=Scytonema hofmannii PCC 7110 TaxID=128403 RepID=A0A139XG08_9CYAN|nr:phage tail protein [Scytonema hofmannii]KYC43634.1 phage tail protein [Scytonema hofmannii PCC 7110]